MKHIRTLAVVMLTWLVVPAPSKNSFQAFAGEAQKGERLRIAYASVTGNRISLWAAQDVGFFARQGFQAELIFIASSSMGVPALIAGEFPMFSGSPETAAQAAVSGINLVIIASNEPTQYKLIVQPTIKKAEELKGKKVGIDRIGGSSYYATRRMLEKVGLKPQDVEFLQVAGGGSQRVAAFHSGILAAVVTTIERFERAKVPYHVLADALSLGVRIIGSSVITSRTFRDRNRDILLRFIRALVEASHWTKNPKNRDGVLKVFRRNLRIDDPAVLDLNYRLYVDPLPLFPYTNMEDLRSNLSDLAESNPKLRELKLSELVDNSFVQRVEAESVKPAR
jgi:ABC-type nitrate/sulfonate/bicarbonate transport system substrate-binding protein